jgi:citrate lyase beta subunit
MKTSLAPADVERLGAPLRTAQATWSALYPGERRERQPVHTVYGGAHLFGTDTVTKLGRLALRALEEHAGDPSTLARVFELTPELAERVHARVAHKLATEPVEDLRIDFEDGYGVRSDAEEDRHAVECGERAARALASGGLAPFFGIRIKPLTADLCERAVRTLDLFATAMLEGTGGALPAGFVLTLPKVQAPDQVATLADLLEALESARSLAPGSLRLELMIEQPQAVIDAQGRVAAPALVRAGRGRCDAVHFGTYDYTASCGIAAAHQSMDHPACDFAKHCLQAALAGTGVWLSDGATNVLPVGDRATVHAAWRLQSRHVRRSLAGGFYQGWDLHPAQLVARFVAVYAFYLDALAAATERLSAFVARAAQATRVGSVFDDAATGQGLLNFFLRGISSGALSENDAQAAGLSLGELRTRSFAAIVAGRSGTSGGSGGSASPILPPVR